MGFGSLAAASQNRRHNRSLSKRGGRAVKNAVTGAASRVKDDAADRFNSTKVGRAVNTAKSAHRKWQEKKAKNQCSYGDCTKKVNRKKHDYCGPPAPTRPQRNSNAIHPCD